jgi:putative oxidoreductase
MKALEKYADQTYALLRIVAGFLFAFHGAQLVFGLFSDSHVPLGSQMGLGGLIELVSGLLVMVGLQTRLAAFLASGTMAVAYFQFHWRFQGGAKLFPAMNQGELSALYCFLFLYLACRGGVKWAVRKES